MEILVTAHGKAAVIALKGELDFNSYKDFEAALQSSLAQEHAPIVLDITGVEHIDSTGIGSIARFWRQAAQNNSELRIAGAKKNILNLINLVNLDKRIKLFQKPEEALS